MLKNFQMRRLDGRFHDAFHINKQGFKLYPPEVDKFRDENGFELLQFYLCDQSGKGFFGNRNLVVVDRYGHDQKPPRVNENYQYFAHNLLCAIGDAAADYLLAHSNKNFRPADFELSCVVAHSFSEETTVNQCASTLRSMGVRMTSKIVWFLLTGFAQKLHLEECERRKMETALKALTADGRDYLFSQPDWKTEWFDWCKTLLDEIKAADDKRSAEREAARQARISRVVH